jgi:PP-loop superfamily ATP-utilizing enzyme
MHVHANYSQQLASLGVSREETREIAARRAAEVRKKLSAASGSILSEIGEEVTVVAPHNGERHAGERRDDERLDPQQQQPEDEEFGRHFSARA